MPTRTKCTPELITELANLVRSGVPLPDAVASKDVNEGTARRWRQRASERPNSIYGRYFAEMTRAVAEATVVDVAVISTAATQPSVTTTTVTKRELRAQGDAEVLVVTEETTTVKQSPPAWQASAWKLGRRSTAFHPKQQIEAQVQHLPPDMLDRTMGELLRRARGDAGPSLLRDDDVEARALLPGE